MRPLYVHGGRASVALDGPALRVKTPRSADRWFPLQRVSRVISARSVDWQTSALLACAERGIVVNFLDDNGVTLARCIGRRADRFSIQARLAEGLSRPDWQERYGTWLAAMERMAVRSVCRRAGFAESEVLDSRKLRRLFRDGAASMQALAAYDRIGRGVIGGLEAVAAQELADVGVDLGALVAWGADLVKDLSAVLFWDFQLARLAWLERRLENDESAKVPEHLEIVEFFERRRVRTERLCQGLIRRLNRWLMEAL